MPTRELFVNTADEQMDGVVASATTEVAAQQQRFAMGDGITIGVIPLKPSGNELQPWTSDFASSDTYKISIGDPDTAPSTGSVILAYDGTNFTINAGADAAAFQTAAQAAINTALGASTPITVTKHGNTEYIVRFTAVGNHPELFTVGANNLAPTSQVVVKELVAGSATLNEVWRISIAQQGLGYSAPTTDYGSLSTTLTATSLQTGTSLVPSIQRLTFPTLPIGGTGIWNYAEPEVSKVICKAPTGAVSHIFKIVTVADVAGSLGGKYFDIYDHDGPIRVWFDVANGSTPPTDPYSGRLLEVDISSGATAPAVAAAANTALNGDSELTSSKVGNEIYTVVDAYGPMSAPSAGDSGFTVSTHTTGAYSDLHGKYFYLYDANGAVCFYYKTAENTPETDGAADASRLVPITIVGNESASATATATQLIIDGDSSFAATVSGAVITVTDSANGARTEAADGDTDFAIQRTTKGASVAEGLPYNATTDDIADSLGEAFTVSKKAPGVYDFTGTSNGARTAITVTTTNLVTPQGKSGTLSFDNQACIERFADEEGDEITTVLQVERVPSGGSPNTILSTSCILVRDLARTA